jgi:alpha-tubulin suppressor-like RCC1 family protein
MISRPARCAAAMATVVALTATSTAVVAAPAAAYTPTVKRVPSTMASSFGDSLFIGADGKVYGVGDNTSGEITGVGPRSTPAALTGLPAGVRATAVSAEFAHSLVLASNGAAYGTGQNTDHQLTGAATADKTTLTKLSGLPAGVRATAVAAGGAFSLVLGSNGVVYGAGDNASGELTGAVSPKTTLTALVGLPAGVKATAVAAGNEFSIVLGSDQRAYGTGSNTLGQISDVDASRAVLAPFQRMPAGVHVIALTAGYVDSVLLGSDQHAYALGSNDDSEFGQDTPTPDTTPHPVPVALPVEHVVAISAGVQSIGMIDSRGVPYVAGRNNFSQLTGASADIATFQTMTIQTGTPSTARFVELNLGWRTSLVRDADGVVVGAGANDSGQVSGANNPQVDLRALAGQKVISYARPTVGGVARVGQVLTAHVGSFSVRPTRYSYRWLRDGAAIPRATGSRHPLTARDRNRRISVVVTGSRSGGFLSGVATSTETSPVANR